MKREEIVSRISKLEIEEMNLRSELYQFEEMENGKDLELMNQLSKVSEEFDMVNGDAKLNALLQEKTEIMSEMRREIADKVPEIVNDYKKRIEQLESEKDELNEKMKLSDEELESMNIE